MATKKKRTRSIKLEKFNEMRVNLTNVEQIILETSVKTGNDLRKNPYQTWHDHRAKHGGYDAGWNVDMKSEHKKQRSVGYVYNRWNWQLTWLLENGHIIVNKRGAPGWAHPHPHIRPSFEKNAKQFKHDMETKLDIDVELR